MAGIGFTIGPRDGRRGRGGSGTPLVSEGQRRVDETASALREGSERIRDWIVVRTKALADRGQELADDAGRTLTERTHDLAERSGELADETTRALGDRTQELAERGGEAADRAVRAASGRVHDLADRGQEVTDRTSRMLAGRAHDMAARGQALADEAARALAERSHDVAARGQSVADDAARALAERSHDVAARGQSVADEAARALSERGQRLADEAARAVAERREAIPVRIGPAAARRSGIPVWVVIVAAAAGAVLGFIFGGLDRRQRKELLDQVRSLMSRAPGAAAKLQRDALNRSRGAIAVVADLTDRGPVIDPVLEARVRSELGRRIRHVRAIDVDASDGTITLSGPVLASEHSAALEGARSVRGVREVEDRLTVHEHAGDIPALQGGSGTPEAARPELLQEEWSPTTRAVGGATGLAGLVIGLSRGGPVGLGLAIAGAAIALRSVTNMTFGRLTGLGGGRRGVDIHKTITVSASPSEVYRLWSRFEEFPRFMSHVQEVRRSEGDRSHWIIRGPVGIPVGFDAETTIDEPERTIAWKSVAGEPIRHSGVVRFRPERGGTRIDLRMTYNPPGGLFGHLGMRLFGDDPRTALDDDLLRFKSLLETGKATANGHETTRDEVGLGVGSTRPGTPTATGDADTASGYGATSGDTGGPPIGTSAGVGSRTSTS